MRRLSVADVSANEPGYTAAEAARQIQQAKVRPAPVRFEWHARHRDGHLMWHEVTLKRATIAGEPRILAFVRDVTERKARRRGAARERGAVPRYLQRHRRRAWCCATPTTASWTSIRRLLAMTGCTREELVGKQRWAFLLPEMDAQGREYHRRVIAGESIQHETASVRKDGTRFDVEVRTVPIQYRGRPHVLAMAREITERRLADEALRASEEQYRAIFNATADALVLRDADNRIVDVNPALLAMTGYAREELVGARRWLFAGPGEDEATVASGTPRARRRNEPPRDPGGRKDGTRFDVEVRSVPIQYRGRPHVLAMARDITARRLADEALRASEEQYRAIFHATADALVLRDAEFRIVDVNPAYEAMSGYARDEVLGADARDRAPGPGQRPAAWRCIRRCSPASRSTWRPKALRKDGTRIEIELRGVPIQHRGPAARRSTSGATSPRASAPKASGSASRRSCARRRRWRRSATSPAASRTTSTTS